MLALARKWRTLFGMKRSILCLMGALSVVAIATVAQEKIKLRQGIKVEIGGKARTSLRYHHEETEFGVLTDDPTAEGIPKKHISGVKWESIVADMDMDGLADRTGALYAIAHDIGVGKGGSDNRFTCSCTFIPEKKQAHPGIAVPPDPPNATLYEAYVRSLAFPGTTEVAEGRGVALEFASLQPISHKGFENTEMDADKDPVFDSVSCSIDGVPVPADAEIGPITIEVPDRKIGGAVNAGWITNTCVIRFMSHDTSLDSLNHDNADGQETKHYALYSFQKGARTLTVSLGECFVQRIRRLKLLDRDVWEVSLAFNGPVEFGVK